MNTILPVSGLQCIATMIAFALWVTLSARAEITIAGSSLNAGGGQSSVGVFSVVSSFGQPVVSTESSGDIPPGSALLIVASGFLSFPSDIGNLAEPPTLVMLAADNLTRFSARLTGEVDPNGTPAAAWFEYGPTESYGMATALVALSGSGTSAVSADLSNLSHSTIYYFRLAASNSVEVIFSPSTFTTAANSAPLPAGDSVERIAGQTAKVLAIKLAANDSDPDGDSLTLTGVSSPTSNGAIIAIEAGWVIYVPPNGFNGTDSFNYDISDGYGGSALGTVTVTMAASGNEITQNIISVQTQPDGSVRVIFVGIPGRTYAIEATDNLSMPWVGLGEAQAGTDGLYDFIDSDAMNHAIRFYRGKSTSR